MWCHPNQFQELQLFSSEEVGAFQQHHLISSRRMPRGLHYWRLRQRGQGWRCRCGGRTRPPTGTPPTSSLIYLLLCFLFPPVAVVSAVTTLFVTTPLVACSGDVGTKQQPTFSYSAKE
uniref:Pco125920 n=1 Tax=Arundo donax TaxID=35708 RepID=A0A0A9EXF9_ARUDO